MTDGMCNFENGKLIQYPDEILDRAFEFAKSDSERLDLLGASLRWHLERKSHSVLEVLSVDKKNRIVTVGTRK